MSHWKKFKLKDISLKIGSGATPTGGSNAYKTKGISLIRSQNVLDLSFSSDGLAFIDEMQARDLQNVTVLENDILLNITGDSVARICKVPQNILPARVNQHVAIIRVDPKYADDNFVLYYLLNQKNQLLSISEIGGTRNALTKQLIENLEIIIPPVESQRLIVQTINYLTAKIDLLHLHNKTSEKILIDYCKYLMNSGKQQSISQLLNIRSGYSFKSSEFSYLGTYRLVTIKNVQDGRLELADMDRISSLPSNMPLHCKLKSKDILLSLTGNVGRVCLVDEDDLVLNQRVAKLEPRQSRDWAFCYSLFRLDSFKKMLEELGKGTAQSNLSPIEVGQMEVYIPSELQLEMFSTIGTPLLERVMRNKFQIKKLAQLRNYLLPKLISGELKLKHAQAQ